MLFLPALLFFLLGTGTSALETGSNDHTLTLPIREGMEDDKIYKRAQGYWQPADRTSIKDPLVVYIHEGKPLVFGPANPDEINTACDGQRIFVRILSEEEYRRDIGVEYPHGAFQNIPGAYEHDRLTIMLLVLEGKMQAAAVKLLPSLIIPMVRYIGIDHKLAEGYWRLEEITGVQHRLVAYIGDRFVLYARNPRNIKFACDGTHNFVRIMTSTEYRQYIEEDYLEGRNGKFQDIHKKHGSIKILLMSLKQAVISEQPISEGVYPLEHFPAELFPEQPRPFSSHSIIQKIIYGEGMNYKRGYGYWTPHIMSDEEIYGMGRILAYIGPNDEGPMKLDYESIVDLLVVGRRKRRWKRVLAVEDYESVTNQKYPESASASFPPKPGMQHLKDRVAVNILKPTKVSPFVQKVAVRLEID